LLQQQKKEILKIGFLQLFYSCDLSHLHPLTFAYLKSYLDAHSTQPFEIKYLEKHDILENNYNVDLLCFSCLSQDFDDVIFLSKKFKENNPDKSIFLGGFHISSFPETLPVDVDVGVIGEGELTFLNLINAYCNDKEKFYAKLYEIDGIIFRDSSGEFIKNRPVNFIENLDSLPLPDRSIFSDNAKQPYLLTSRGCPYSCTFCSSRVFWNKPRFFSPEYICNDIKTIMGLYNIPDVIGLWDDLFVADRKRLYEIRDILYKEGILRNIQLACNIRANLMDEDLCVLLHQLRITAVSFGFESGVDRILKSLKPHVSVETNLKALDLLSQYNISACCSFIFGIQGELEKDINETYELILNLIKNDKLYRPIVNIFMPMPDTVFWDQAESMGLIDVNNFRWSSMRHYASFRDSTFDTPEEWAQARVKNRSIYMNENNVSEQLLLEMIIDYEHKISDALNEQSRKNKPPYLYYSLIDLKQPYNAQSIVLSKVKDSSDVLEYGSSGGHMTKVLADKKCKVDCIEIDRKVAYMAYQFAENVYVADLEGDSFFKEKIGVKSYDYILFCDVLEHLNNPQKCLSAIKEKLKDNGKVLASIPNVAHGSVRLKLLKGKFEYEESGLLDQSHLRFFEFYSIIDLFNESGFFIEEFDLVRIPLEHPLSKINLEEFDPNIVQQVRLDKTSDVFQYVITARKMHKQDDVNIPEILFKKNFPEQIISENAASQQPDIQHPPSILRRVKNKIKRLVR